MLHVSSIFHWIYLQWSTRRLTVLIWRVEEHTVTLVLIQNERTFQVWVFSVAPRGDTFTWVKNRLEQKYFGNKLCKSCLFYFSGSVIRGKGLKYTVHWFHNLHQSKLLSFIIWFWNPSCSLTCSFSPHLSCKDIKHPSCNIVCVTGAQIPINSPDYLSRPSSPHLPSDSRKQGQTN